MANPVLFVSDIDLMKEINIRQFSNFSMRQKPDEGSTVMGKWAKVKGVLCKSRTFIKAIKSPKFVRNPLKKT